MQNSKLFKLIAKLSGYDKKQVLKFLNSPFHNQRPALVALFEILYKHSREGASASAEMITHKSVWQACFGEAVPYKDSDLRNMMSTLLERIEAAFAVPHFIQAQNIDNQIWKYHFYAQKQLSEHQLDVHENILKILAKRSFPLSVEQLRHEYEYEQINYKQKSITQRTNTEALQSFSDSLEVCFIAERLQQACSILSVQNLSPNQIKPNLLEHILDFLPTQRPEWLEIPAIGLYYYFYKSASETQPETQQQFFNTYTQLLFALPATYPLEELLLLYRLGVNYCIKKLNTHSNQADIKQTHEQQLFRFYQLALDKGIFIENEQINRFTYKNIVALSLRLGLFDWTKDFITRYTQYLNPSYSATYANYAKGKYAFAIKNYPDALLYLQKVNYEEIFLNLDARVMQLKIYYELSEYEVLEAFLQSFRMFLIRQRKRLMYHYEVYKNIIHFVQALMRLPTLSKSQINRLRQKITATPTLTEREWLLEKIEKPK
jgi:hypothetical protein